MIWRLHLRSSVSNGISHDNLVKYCVDNSIAGIGWALYKAKSIPKTKEEYVIGAKAEYSKTPASVGFVCNPSIGDFIWARNIQGIYYLGKIISDWYYEHSSHGYDIPNQRKCEWKEIGSEANVPGKVIASFRSRRAFQAIDGLAAQAASLYLYNDNDIEYLKPLKQSDSNLFSLIDYQDCEDLVGLYLQHHHNYLIVPSSCKKDTIGTEFLLKHRVTGDKAFVQVKQGNVDPSLLNVPFDIKKVFYFTSEGKVSDTSLKAHVIKTSEIIKFCKQYQKLLPEHVVHWMKLLNLSESETVIDPPL